MTLIDDTCAWCNHALKVADRHWERARSHYAIPLCANFCTNKTCNEEECEHKCEEIAFSSAENEEKVLHEVVRRQRKLERLEADARKALEAANES